MDGSHQQAVAATWFELGPAMILAVVLLVSIRVLAVPPASILILLLLFVRVMPRIMSAQHHYRAFVNSLPSFPNLVNIEARCVAAAEPAAHSHDRLSLTRELSADDIVHLQRGPRAAVRDLSLVIPAGKVVALVGPSGAGKSTIADILMGLFCRTRARFDSTAVRSGQKARADGAIKSVTSRPTHFSFTTRYART